MPQPRFRIMARNLEGHAFCAFTWTRDAQSGIARAKREAREFGIDVTDIWAEVI